MCYSCSFFSTPSLADCSLDSVVGPVAGALGPGLCPAGWVLSMRAGSTPAFGQALLASCFRASACKSGARYAPELNEPCDLSGAAPTHLISPQ